MADLGPTIGFLAAVLVVGARCEADGLFRAAGERAATLARGGPVRLLAIVFVLASAVTAVLSLDATVVFVTPVAFATASALALRAKPHVYSCVHLANSASILLPVSNLTNLLAFQATGLSFPRFGALMALPWLAAIGVEWAVIRRFFARELGGSGRVRRERVRAPLPRWSLIVLALTLAGFLASSALGVDPRSWPASGRCCWSGRRCGPGGPPRPRWAGPPTPPSWPSSARWRSWSRAPRCTDWATSWPGSCPAGRRSRRSWPSRPSPPPWPTWSTTCRPSCSSSPS